MFKSLGNSDLGMVLGCVELFVDVMHLAARFASSDSGKDVRRSSDLDLSVGRLDFGQNPYGLEHPSFLFPVATTSNLPETAGPFLRFVFLEYREVYHFNALKSLKAKPKSLSFMACGRRRFLWFQPPVFFLLALEESKKKT